VSPKYSLTFLALSAACVAGWVASRADLGWAAWAFLHAALSFGLLSVAYAGAGPSLLLKRASGRRSAWGWLLFGPYYLLNAAIFGAYRRLSGEPPVAQVGHNLFFGRRLSAREAEGLGCAHVLDLACEFAEVRPLRCRPGYRSLPLPDGAAPAHDQLREGAAWVAGAVESGPVYVHCALGHGRSGSVVIAYLLSAGLVGTVTEGVQLLRSLRPGAEPNSAQHGRLCDFQTRRLRGMANTRAQ
jgi:hypothetical protein